MLTIIIPTHNRSTYLARAIRFYQNISSDCIILVADSSDKYHFDKNVNTIDKADPFLKIQHLNFQGIDIFEKFISAIKSVETKYVCFCGDDDYIFIDDSKKYTSFLEEHPDYSHVHGIVLTFRINKNKSPVYRAYRQMPNENENPLRRLQEHFKHYNNNFYSVHRTKSLQKNYASVLEMNIGRSLFERALSALDLIDGKRKMFDTIFMIREKGHTGIDEDGKKTFEDDLPLRMQVENLSYGFDDYLNMIKSYLTKNGDYTTAQLEEVASELTHDFNRWKRNKLNSESSIMNFMRSHTVLIRNHIAESKSKLLLDSFSVEDRQKIQIVDKSIRNSLVP